MKWTIYSDGGARGNPGIAGGGVVIQRDGLVIKEIAKKFGKKTNNQAEYLALLTGISWLLEQERDDSDKYEFFSDSELVVRQLNGQYRVKDAGLKELYLQVIDGIGKLGKEVNIGHVRREINQEADRLANLAMDQQ